jgi:DNA-binding HxlR family transcriptional regulator
MSLDIFGDRWSLLIVRDLMVRGCHRFKEFLESGEGIASNILSDRLQKLEAMGIICGERGADRRQIDYRLTARGIELAPVMLELLIWGARHEAGGSARGMAAAMEKRREAILEEVRRRWRERDLTPLQDKSGKWNLP